MKYRIDGPIPAFVSATEDGAEIDISRHLVTAVFAALFEAADNDPEGFGEELADMHALAMSAQRRGNDSAARHEFDTRMEKYLEEFADGGVLRLFGAAVGQLRDACGEITKPRPVAGQRGAA